MYEFLNELKTLDDQSKMLLKELKDLNENMNGIDEFLTNIESITDRTAKTLELYKRIVNNENF